MIQPVKYRRNFKNNPETHPQKKKILRLLAEPSLLLDFKKELKEAQEGLFRSVMCCCCCSGDCLQQLLINLGESFFAYLLLDDTNLEKGQSKI